jgi:nucleophosmin 1
MFYGLVLKPGVPVSIDSDLGEVLHISQACLSDPKGTGKTYVKIKENDSTYSICCLQKDTQEHANLDLFMQAATAPSFVAEGTNEVHLIGYWEPNPSLSDEDDDDMAGLMEGEGVSDSDEEDAEEMERFAKKLPTIEDLGEDSDEDDDEDDENEVAPAAVVPKPKGLPAGASANKQKPGQKGGDKPPQQNKNQQGPQPKSKASPKANDAQPAQKRKAAETPPVAEPASKQAKPAATAAKVDAGSEDKFQADLVEYLKKNGRTSMSELGSKVKKPAGVAKKIGVFLKERKDTFKIDGNNVLLSQ